MYFGDINSVFLVTITCSVLQIFFMLHLKLTLNLLECLLFCSQLILPMGTISMAPLHGRTR